MVISDKADLKATNDTRVKNRNIILIKESIHEEYIKILKIYAPINSFNTWSKTWQDQREKKFTITNTRF